MIGRAKSFKNGTKGTDFERKVCFFSFSIDNRVNTLSIFTNL